MNSEKSINSFETKKDDTLPGYLLENNFHCQYVDDFSLLFLCKINALDIFTMILIFFFRFLLHPKVLKF